MATLGATTDGYVLPPWDGKESDYVTIFALIATSLAWVAVGGRLFARWKYWALGADDWLVIPATVNNCSLLPPPFQSSIAVYISYLGVLVEGGLWKGCGNFLICLVTGNGEHRHGVLCGLESRYWQALVGDFGRGV